MKKRDFTIHVAKTKALISCAVPAQLICAIVFAYAKIRFSHDEAQMTSVLIQGGQIHGLIFMIDSHLPIKR